MGILNSLVVGSAPLMPKFMIGKIASVYVAGDKLEDGLKLAKKLNSKGFSATLDLLGEEVEKLCLKICARFRETLTRGQKL